MKDATSMTTPSAWEKLFFLNVNNIQSIIPEDQKNITAQWRTGRHFTAATQALNKSYKYLVRFMCVVFGQLHSCFVIDHVEYF